MIGAASRNGRLILSLARPDKANALTAGMLADLVKAVRGAAERPELRALVLTGEGRVFSAGADLAEVREGDLAVSPLWEELSGAVAESPLVTVAALNGSCAGGALGMVLACDMRVAVRQAEFFYPVLKMGVLPQPSDPGRLAALIGPARAKLMLLGGVRIGAEEAQEAGLVDLIAEDVLAAAIDLTEAACAAPPGHAARIKAMVR